MPWISMTQQEEERIVQSLQEKGKGNHLHGMSPKHLYMMLCQRCHAAQGDGLGTIQPNLANFPRAFWKNAEFFRRISDERIVKSVEKGIPGTSMPPYGEFLGHESVNSLIDLIFREFIRIKRDDKRSDLTVPPKPAVILSREKTEKEYHQTLFLMPRGCGNWKGTGIFKIPPSGRRDLTNRPYFGSLTDDRIAMAIFYGVPGTGMGPFGEKISGNGLVPRNQNPGIVWYSRRSWASQWIGENLFSREPSLQGLERSLAGLAWIFEDVWTAASRFSSARWIPVAPLDQIQPDSTVPYPGIQDRHPEDGSEDRSHQPGMHPSGLPGERGGSGIFLPLPRKRFRAFGASLFRAGKILFHGMM